MADKGSASGAKKVTLRTPSTDLIKKRVGK